MTARPQRRSWVRTCPICDKPFNMRTASHSQWPRGRGWRGAYAHMLCAIPERAA